MEEIAKFKEINEAYEILSDSVKKADYAKARKFYNYGTQNRSAKSSYDKTSTNPAYKETYTAKKEEKKNTQSLEDYEKACEEYYDRTYGKSWRTAMGYLD